MASSDAQGLLSRHACLRPLGAETAVPAGSHDGIRYAHVWTRVTRLGDPVTSNNLGEGSSSYI